MNRVSYYIKYQIPHSVGGRILILAAKSAIFVSLLVLLWFGVNASSAFSESATVQRLKSFGYELRWTTYWGYRYYTHTNSVEILMPERRLSGTLEGLTETAEVVLRVYRDNEVQRVQVALADLRINQPVEAAQLVNRLHRDAVAVDYYSFRERGEERSQVVVWLSTGNPLNEVLIEEGLAQAISTPPTNIVNRLMYTYHLNNLRRRNEN